jgi:hypothetical protein
MISDSCCITVKQPNCMLDTLPLLSVFLADTEPFWPQLEAIKAQHQGEALWTALQLAPPARTAALKGEQQARNEVKGFWHDTLRTMAQVRNGAGKC